MNIHLKRILCLVLVVCLMITITGCSADMAGLGSAISHLLRTGIYLGACGLTIGAMFVVDLITWPFVEYTGFNVNALGNRICQSITEAILPENLMDNGWWGGWFVIRDEEELEAKLRKGGHLKDGETLDDMVLKAVFGEDIPENIFGTDAPEETGEAEDGMDSIVVTEEKLYADATIPTETTEYPEQELLVPGENEAALYYELHGGYNAPEAHLVKVSGILNTIANVFVPAKFPDTVPVNPGHHFLGWVIPGEIGFEGEVTGEDLTAFVEKNWNEVKENLHHPGDKISADTRKALETHTTLHAVWLADGGMNAAMLFDHRFAVKQEKASHVVTVKCSCGLTINDSSISLDAFRRYCTDSGLSDREAQRLYTLFRAQHLGYLALYFNGMFYEESPDYLEMYSTVEDIAGLFEDVEPVVKAYALKQYTSDADKELVEEVFEDIAGARDKITGAMDKVSSAISLWQAGKVIHQMLDSDGGLISQTVGMLDTIDAISSYLGVDAIASPVVEVLKISMDAVEALEKSNRKYEFALSAGTNSFPASHEYLNQIFSGSATFGQAVQELTFGKGCQCSPNSGTDGCNFSYHSGMALHQGPDTVETVQKMAEIQTSTLLQPGAEEQEFLMYYLAERSRHDLYALTGLTLEGYCALIQSQKAYDAWLAG